MKLVFDKSSLICYEVDMYTVLTIIDEGCKLNYLYLPLKNTSEISAW